MQVNQFVSPTLGVAPTDRQYDAYLGLKGKLMSNISYNVRAGYKAEKIYHLKCAWEHSPAHGSLIGSDTYKKY